MAACSKGPGQSMREYAVRAEFAPSTRLHLEDTSSPLVSGRYWKWSGDDVLTLTYSDGGDVASCEPSSVRLDAEDGRYAVFTFKIPSSARALSLEYGSELAFGKVCDGDIDIPGEMVYARAVISAEAGEQNLPAGILQHRCSYLRIDPVVVGKVVRSILISGTGLKGNVGVAGSISIPIEKTFPFWVAVCNEASAITVESVDSQGNKTLIASLDDAGKGSCNLYEISYKPVIDYRK